MTVMFHDKHVEGTQENQRICACGGECRPGQWDCHACHALSMTVHRARRLELVRKLHSAKFGKIDDKMRTPSGAGM